MPLLAADLSVSAYTWVPDPVVRGGASTFTVTVTNNDAGVSVGNLTLTVNLPSNIDFSASSVTVPSGAYTLASPFTTLTCTRAAALAPQGTWVVTFTGVGSVAGTQNTTATVTASGNTDLNADNDFLTKPTTVINGADLSIAKTGPGTCIAGDAISFTVRVTNHGPDPATTFRVTDNLPALVDFSYGSATGTGWTFSRTGTTLTCDYAGAAIASGADAPDITITGTVITTSGSITNGASVVSTDGTTGDPVAGNNGPSQAVVTVTPGTNLRANKTMVSAATGMTTYATGEAVTLTLTATNLGPQAATGVVLTDVVPAHFTLLASSGTGWAASGQTISCTVGNLASGATSSTFTIPLTASGAAGSSGTNTATITRTTPVGGANTSASVAYTIVDAFAHLTIAKSKGPNPVAENGLMTSTIVVTNDMSSTSAATGTIRVTDTLSSHETYESFSGTGWVAVNVASNPLVFEYTGANLARGASLPTLSVVTRAAAGFLGTITNTACIVGSSHTPPDNVSGDCDSATVTGTNRSVNIGVTKTASIPAPSHITTTDSSYSYTIDVTNSGVDTAPTVIVTDPLGMWYSGDAGTTTGSAVVSGAGSGSDTATFGSTVSATLRDLAPGQTRTLTITLNRPFLDGSFTNTASVSLPDSIDTDPSDNSDTADVVIDPIADVTVTNIADAPDPVKVGVELTYTTSIKNNGPSTAAGVLAYHRIDTARMTYVPGSASLTVGGTATYHTSLPDGPYAGEPGIRCSGFSLANGESRQLTFKVIPVYPYPDALTATYTSTAAISTTTVESSTANNTATNDAHVTLQALDLSVTDNDPGYDPTAFGDPIIYQITAQNNGPSQATGFVLTVTPAAPAGGSPNPYTMVFDAAGSTLPAGATYTTSGSDLLFYLGASQAQSVLAANSSRTFSLKFNTGPITDAPASSITYRTTATVSSYESLAGYDTLTGNNSVTETTTVLPKTDLILVSKTVSKPTVDLNEPFTYTITVGNKGPSDVSGLTVTDVLPSGFLMTGAPTVTPGSAVTLTTSTISAPAVGSGGTLTFTLGPLPADTTGTDTTKQVVLTVPVRAAYQSGGSYAFAFNTNIPNTATVAVVPGVSLDPDGTNNSQTVNVQVRKNSITGLVFRDASPPAHSNPPVATAYGINGVTFVLSASGGQDAYGNAIANITRTSNSSGVFLFDNLPPGSWNLAETQPAGYSDGLEAAGTAGGTAPPLDWVNNGGGAGANHAHNTITGISLPVDVATSGSGYLFQEFRNATVSGYVYHDRNNDGNRDSATESAGISAVSIRVQGVDYRGNAYGPVLQPSNGSGFFTFTNSVPPGTNYTITEVVQPASWLDGADQNGSGLPNVVAGSRATDVISLGNVQGAASAASISYTERNFGELSPATLGGYVFIDQDSDAIRDAGETAGAFGVTVTLTGTDDLGNAIHTTTTSGANGQYSFGNLRPGTYTVTEIVPAGLTHTGAQAGSKGGTIDGSVRTSGTAVTGLGVTVISGITIASGDTAAGYNFGETGLGLAGYVYVDLNGNGTKDAGEPGIPGITVTLSGQTSGGVDVCVAISPNPCTVTTDASGAYSYTGLPLSNGSGYTLTEQSQSSAPLSSYADGLDALGSLGGTLANDQFSAIPLTGAFFGTDYNFGEVGGSISGRVYLDVNRDGSYDGGDGNLAGITITLSGTTASGANVCTILPTCTFTTASDGTFTIAGLPAGIYTLAEAQPADYASATTTAGSGGGTPGPTTITGIAVPVGTPVTGYLFGEKTGSLAGHVYLDHNNNGLMDLGESGIAGASLRLTGTSAGGSAIDVTVTTTADGSYTFDNLPNANGSGYTVTETQPTGYLDGKHAAGSGGGNVTVSNVISAIPFSAATAFTAYNFGELQAASLSGHVYRDDNNDSVQDPGEALAGVTLTLTGTDDQGTAVNLVTTTAADGTYGFTNLRPSNGTGYTLTETQPTGYGNFTGATGTMVGTVAGTTTGTAALNQTSGILLGSGQSGLDYDFRENASGISGFVFNDLDNDGVKDSGEAGIAGVTVTLSGTATGTTTTAADGSYAFAGLTSGTYTLTETQPTGYLDGLHTAGSGGGNATVVNVISAISLTPGASFTGYNFGEVQAASLSGHVYRDADYDSTLDAGEALSGVTLTLTGNDDQGSAVSLTTTTATDGTYTFAGFRPSSSAGYILTETQPANVDDFPGTTGTLVGTVASTTMGTAGINQVTGIVLGSAGTGLNYDFRESTSSLSGFVYVDANDNGLMDAGETGIAGVTVALSGAASATTTTASDGSYAFPGLVGGTYTLTETHPVIYQDGREAAGSPAGTVDNGSFTFAAAQNRISSITLPVATSGTGYLFGERTGLAGSFSGKVWYNSVTRNQTQDSGEPGLAGWRVEVVQGGIVRGSATTASDGTWTVSGLAAASGYEIVFRHPNNNAVYGDPVSQDPSYTDSTPNYAFHTIRNMTLRSGGSVIEQNLPIDPSGVVYDAITRNPVSGATVAISGPGGFNPATHLVGGAANQSQVTDATGFYQFLLLPTAPAGTYMLSVNGPAIYVPGTSSIIPPAAGPLDPGAGPGNYAVQAQPSAPTGAQATTYYLTFSLDSASASVVNNHLPVDPVLGGALVVTKTTPKMNVVRGELVPYTITARNTLAATLSNLDLVDEVPPGFKYVSGSAQLDGMKLEPVVSGRTLRWRNLTFTAGQTRTFKLVLVVGSGVGEGEYTNRAWALNNIVNTAVSNIGSATVRLVPDPTFDCTDIIGKVFDDRNANGFQDEGEPGLPNIVLATVKGRLITTDAEGRYHIPCAEVPQMDRGSNFILKLDARTLPSGYRMTTENPRVVRATRGKMVKLNFGAALHRVIRLEVSDAAFEGDALKPEWKRRFEELPRLLAEKPGVVRLVYRHLPPDKQRAKERLNALAAELRKRWKERDDRYPLSIELERVEVTR